MLRNPFNALCEIASRENWCWNLSCTTCGCREFRYGLFQIGSGLHPDDANWNDPAEHMRKAPRGEMQKIRGDVQENAMLQTVLADADLAALSTSCRFPDYLGYLGLALSSTEGIESKNRLLTSSWVPQLRSMVSEGSPADLSLERHPVEGTRLRWSDLESVEKDFSRSCRDEPG